MPTMAISDRRSIELPAQLVEDVGAIAKRRGHILSMLIGTAITTATKAAERGDFPSLPHRLPPFVGKAEQQKILKYTVSAEEAARSVAALRRAGSSVRAVVIRYFEAYRDADGSLFDVVAPGDPGAMYRQAGAA
jgi:hypothetical protein